MLMTRIAVLSYCLLSAACGPKYVDLEAREIPKTPLKGGIAEFTMSSFDGEVLKGRVLLGATIDTLVIDGRLMEYIYVELKKLRTCGKTDRLPHYDFDFVYPPVQRHEIITVRPGFWYGANVSFHIFDKKESPGLPDCFEADLIVRVMDGRVAATLPIRVGLVEKKTAPPAPPPAIP